MRVESNELRIFRLDVLFVVSILYFLTTIFLDVTQSLAVATLLVDVRAVFLARRVIDVTIDTIVIFMIFRAISIIFLTIAIIAFFNITIFSIVFTVLVVSILIDANHINDFFLLQSIFLLFQMLHQFLEFEKLLVDASFIVFDREKRVEVRRQLVQNFNDEDILHVDIEIVDFLFELS